MQFHIKISEFIISAAQSEQWPDDNVPEVCLLGRSNVGKSSFINTITQRRKLAYVASRPGKTQLLNFFSINNNFIRLVDAPGYGYSSISHHLQNKFEKLMNDYLTKRGNLKLACLLVDLRHKPTALDVQMFEFLSHYQIPILIVGTKCDKLSNNRLKKHVKVIREALAIPPEFPFVITSSLKKIGKDDFWNFTFTHLITK